MFDPRVAPMGQTQNGREHVANSSSAALANLYAFVLPSHQWAATILQSCQISLEVRKCGSKRMWKVLNQHAVPCGAAVDWRPTEDLEQLTLKFGRALPQGLASVFLVFEYPLREGLSGFYRQVPSPVAY